MISTIEHLDPGSLRLWAKNARTHSKKQLRQIAKSIETFGFTNPVLIDQHGTILAGHGRVEAAKSLGMSTVPCLRIEHMTEDEKRAYVIADNKLALNAGWDEELLAQELQGLLATEDLGFDIGVIGFEVAELDSLVEALNPEEPGNPEDDVIPEIAPRRVNPGDIWQLGSHRLICGDALDPQVLDDLMQGELARMVFADPPYNVKIDGHVGGSGKIQHREFAMASGEMTDAEFTTFLTKALRNMEQALARRDLRRWLEHALLSHAPRDNRPLFEGTSEQMTFLAVQPGGLFWEGSAAEISVGPLGGTAIAVGLDAASREDRQMTPAPSRRTSPTTASARSSLKPPPTAARSATPTTGAAWSRPAPTGVASPPPIPMTTPAASP